MKKLLKKAYRSSIIAQIGVFILFTSFMFMTVSHQLFYRWTSDYIYPRYMIVYLLEACYFAFGYDFFLNLTKVQSKSKAIFFSFCLAVIGSRVFLYKGFRGAVTCEGLKWELDFSAHPIVVWFVLYGVIAVAKKYYLARKKSRQ